MDDKSPEDTKAEKKKIFRIVTVDSSHKMDWSISYPGVVEAGRGILECEGKLTDIIIRYYSYQRLRFEKIRHFAEINITKKDKFILDGMELIPLVQHITEVAWPIIECRKKMKKCNTNLKLVKK